MALMRWIGPFPRKRLAGQLLWFGAWVSVTGVALYLQPSPHGHGTHHQLGLPPCPSVLLFDRPCPGCGLTTSFAHTVRFEFADAFAAHPFGTVLYLVFTVTAFLALGGFVRQTYASYDTRAFRFASTWFFVAFLAYGLLRFALRDGYGAWSETDLARFIGPPDR